MALRMVEIVVPAASHDRVLELLEDHDVIGSWSERLRDDHALVRVLMRAEATEGLLDAAESSLSDTEGFRVVLFEVAATLPRPDESDGKGNAEQDEDEPEDEAEADSADPPSLRVNREELHASLSDGARLSMVFAVTVVLSAVVAAMGLRLDDPAVIIGAMVIAPLLGPNISLAFATTLADGDLAVRSLKSNGAGLFLGFAAALLLGLGLDVDPTTPALAARTHVVVEHLALALASGAAGALAFTSGAPAALVGVMVAVALLPPLVAVGLLLGAGHASLALEALLLLVTNIICVQLAAIVTFVAQGIRPGTWYEADKAKRAVVIAIATLLLLLAALVVLILVAAER